MDITYFKNNISNFEIVSYKNSTLAFTKHTHVRHYVIGIVKEGEICLKVENTKFNCQKNGIFIIYPNIPHSVFPITEMYSMISVCIPTDHNVKNSLDVIKSQILNNPEQQFSLNDMAKTAFITPYHLIRKFESENGLTPHQFQIQCRIRKAQRLLERNIKVAEAAQETGFCDQSHFSKTFKRLVGFSPIEYSARVRYI